MKTVPSTKQQILDMLDRLTPEQQESVLAYVQALAGKPEGIPAGEFLQFFRDHPVTPDEAEKMQQIMQELGW